MTIFVAGVSGLLGSALAEQAGARGHRVIGTRHATTGPTVGVDELLTVDLTDEAATRKAVLGARPAAIVNCAAVSVPFECQQNPEYSRKLNVALPTLLAQLARGLGARLVHASSEQVFDGKQREPYRATDPVSPINVYGEQKVESERSVHATAGDLAVTVRPPLLLGNSSTGTRSVHEQLFVAWAAGKTPKLFADEYRQPCTAANLASVILKLCENRDVSGVFHWAGEESLSRYELAERIRSRFGLKENVAPLAGQTREQLPDTAKIRPQYLQLDVSPLCERLGVHPEALEAQLASLKVPAALAEWYRGAVR